MTLTLKTIDFNLFGTDYSINLWVIEEEDADLIHELNQWSEQTEEFTAYSFSRYLQSKGHFALTDPEYMHRIKLQPYFDKLEAGADIEKFVQEILQRKGILNRLDQVINSFYSNCGHDPADSTDKKMAFIKEVCGAFADYLVDLPLLDD